MTLLEGLLLVAGWAAAGTSPAPAAPPPHVLALTQCKSVTGQRFEVQLRSRVPDPSAGKTSVWVGPPGGRLVAAFPGEHEYMFRGPHVSADPCPGTDAVHVAPNRVVVFIARNGLPGGPHLGAFLWDTARGRLLDALPDLGWVFSISPEATSSLEVGAYFSPASCYQASCSVLGKELPVAADALYFPTWWRLTVEGDKLVPQLDATRTYEQSHETETIRDQATFERIFQLGQLRAPQAVEYYRARFEGGKTCYWLEADHGTDWKPKDLGRMRCVGP